MNLPFFLKLLRGSVKKPKKGLNSFILPSAQARWLAAGISHYTPERVEQIFRLALSGDIQSQWEMFDLMEATWPQLSKNLNELKDSVTGMELEVVPWSAKGGEPTPEALRRAKLVESALWSMEPDADGDENDFEDTLRDIMDARGKGVSVLETEWILKKGPGGMMWAPRCTRWVHPSWYGWPSANETRIMRKDPSGGWSRFEKENFIIAICKNKTGHPLGSAMLHCLAPWWAAMNFSFDWFLNYAQIFGQPIRWATYDESLSDTDKAVLGQMLANMGSAAYAMFPSGTALELKEASGGAQDNPQAALIRMADKVCDIAVLRQTLTSDVGDGGSGSRALGEVHERKEGGVKLACAKWACKTMGQLVRAICQKNFGDTRECPWLRPRLDTESAPMELAGVVEVLSRAGLEPTDDAIASLSESVKIPLQRKVFGQPSQPPVSMEEERGGELDDPQDTETQLDAKTAARCRFETHSKLSAKPPPSDAVAAAKAEALARAFRGTLAPVRDLILASTSPEDALAKVSAHFKDWPAERVADTVDEALQLCAVAGTELAPRRKE